MKLSEMLVKLMTNASNSSLVWFWRLGPSYVHFVSFQIVGITQQPIIVGFKFFVLLKVGIVATEIVKHQELKMKLPHDINNFWKS